MKKFASILLVSSLISGLVMACPCDNLQKQAELKEKLELAEKVLKLEDTPENKQAVEELQQRLAQLEQEMLDQTNA